MGGGDGWRRGWRRPYYLLYGAEDNEVEFVGQGFGASGVDFCGQTQDSDGLASRDEARLFCFWDSARVTAISGRMMAMGMPGNPAPEPKSRRVETFSGSEWAQRMDLKEVAA